MFKVTLDREEQTNSKLISNPHKMHIYFSIISVALSSFFTNTNKTNMFWLWKITLKAYWDPFLLALSYFQDKCASVMHRNMPDWHIHSGVLNRVLSDCYIASSERFCHQILIKPTVDRAQDRLNTTHSSLPQWH